MANVRPQSESGVMAFPAGKKVMVQFDYGDGAVHAWEGLTVASADDRFFTLKLDKSGETIAISVDRIYWVKLM
jgi:hypothetical protein